MSSIFYGNVMSEIPNIASSSASALILYEKSSELITWKEKQNENSEILVTQIFEGICFQKYDIWKRLTHLNDTFFMVYPRKKKQDGNRRKLIKQILKVYVFRSMICCDRSMRSMRYFANI